MRCFAWLPYTWPDNVRELYRLVCDEHDYESLPALLEADITFLNNSGVRSLLDWTESRPAVISLPLIRVITKAILDEGTKTYTPETMATEVLARIYDVDAKDIEERIATAKESHDPHL